MHTFCEQLRAYYTDLVHGYLSIGICITGIIFNILNIFIFSRKNMSSPVNAILLTLAIVNFIFLLGSIPYLYNSHVMAADDTCFNRFTYTWTLYVFLFSIVALPMYGMYIWLTIMLSVYRHMVVVYPFKQGIWNSTKKTYVISIGLCVLNLLWVVFPYLETQIQSKNLLPDENKKITNNLCTSTNETYYEVAYFSLEIGILKYWNVVYAILFCLIPLVLHIFLITRWVEESFL